MFGLHPGSEVRVGQPQGLRWHQQGVRACKHLKGGWLQGWQLWACGPGFRFQVFRRQSCGVKFGYEPKIWNSSMVEGQAGKADVKRVSADEEAQKTMQPPKCKRNKDPQRTLQKQFSCCGCILVDQDQDRFRGF